MTARRSRRDLATEVGMWIAADAELSDQPWVPLQPGDVVLRYVPPAGDVPAHGATYLAVEEGTDLIGHAMLREVSHTGPAFDDQVDVNESQLDYVLRYDTGDQRWRLDWRDNPLSGPEPWLDAPDHIGVDDVEAAQAWAAGEIRRNERGREPTGWREITGRRYTPAALADIEQASPAGPALVSFYDMWMGEIPSDLVVIRGGAVVQGIPARAELPAAGGVPTSGAPGERKHGEHGN